MCALNLWTNRSRSFLGPSTSAPAQGTLNACPCWHSITRELPIPQSPKEIQVYFAIPSITIAKAYWLTTS